MAIHARTRVADLIEDHPDVDEVFETYGIEVDDDVMAMTLKEVCRTEGLNYWEFKSDIVEAVGWDGSAEDDDEEEDDDDDDDVVRDEDGDDDDGWDGDDNEDDLGDDDDDDDAGDDDEEEEEEFEED